MQQLIQSLTARQPAVRWQAAARLAEVARRSREALTALDTALQDEHPFVRWQAAIALARARSPEAKTILYDTLRAGSPRAQSAVLDALGQMGGTDVSLLLRALEHEDASVRQSAVEALARQRVRAVAPRLVDLLRDPAPGVRKAAASALAHLWDARATPTLMERLEDASPLVRRSAAYALGARRIRMALPALLRALNDPQPEVRYTVAWALGRLGASEAIPHLEKLLHDSALDGMVALEAARAIRSMMCRGWRRLGCWLRRDHAARSLAEDVR